jgi:hypothetical protein
MQIMHWISMVSGNCKASLLESSKPKIAVNISHSACNNKKLRYMFEHKSIDHIRYGHSCERSPAKASVYVLD